MAGWFVNGLRNGIKTGLYPRNIEDAPGTVPWSVVDTLMPSPAEAGEVVARCPVGALRAEDSMVAVDRRRCISCRLCLYDVNTPMKWSPADEWMKADGEKELIDSRGRGVFGPSLRRSVHILVVDAGDCGACLNEVRQLNAPQYNMHRLGFFITPTPRKADLLLVVGQVTDAMREPLLSAYRAMPDPKRVLAVGNCALDAPLPGESFTACSGVGEVLPVDAEVAGSPPSPLMILRVLLAITGRPAPGSYT